MRIEIFGDGIDRSHINKTNHKISARAVVVDEGKVLSVYFTKTDHYNLPGGGLETGETLSDCVIREVKEETGYDVSVVAETVIVLEYYPDSTWESHFFRCDLRNSQNSATNLTDEEKTTGLITRWIELYAFLEILETSPTNHPNGQNIHQRELIGLLNSL